MNTNYSDRRSMRAACAICLSMTLVAGVCSADDAAAEANDLWDVQVGLPFWATGLDGEVGVRGRSAHVDEDFSDIVDILDFAIGLNTEVRYQRRWLFFANMSYVQTTADAEPGRRLAGTIDEVQLKQKEYDVDFGIGYNLFPHSAFRIEPFVAGRVTWLDAEISLAVPGTNPEFDGSKAWADPIVGVMLKFPANSFLSFFAEGDIGGFGVSSDLTWQINAGGELKLGRHFYSRLTWRHQETDLEDGDFIYDVRKSGPQLELGFRF
jgi:hypothetical protein